MWGLQACLVLAPLLDVGQLLLLLLDGALGFELLLLGQHALLVQLLLHLCIMHPW